MENQENYTTLGKDPEEVRTYPERRESNGIGHNFPKSRRREYHGWNPVNILCDCYSDSLL